MDFNAHIRVYVNGNIVQTVVAVRTRNEGQNIGASADVMVPMNCRVQYKDGKKDYLTDQPKNLFNAGDMIKIVTWFDGYPEIVEFEGFIYDFVLGDVTTIKCLDYVYKLSLTTLNISHKTISIKDLVEKYVLLGTGITLMKGTPDIPLVDISFAYVSPAAVLEHLKKEIGLNISLIGKQLYLNIASNTRRVVKLDTRRNVLKSNMQKPDAVFRRVKVKAWFVRKDGKKDSVEVGDPNGQITEKWFNNVRQDITTYRKLAREAYLKEIQYKYSGTLETLIYPDAHLFDKVIYSDYRYPEKDGNYVVTGRALNVDANQFSRTLRVSFLTDLISDQYA